MIPPRISFVLITHARAQYLSRALESIRRQSIDDREIIVVVNGRDPETEEMLRTYVDVRVKVLEENLGVGGGRNVGIGMARGEILLFLDDDAELRSRDTAGRVLAGFDAEANLGVLGLLSFDAATGKVEERCVPFRNKRVPEKTTAACYFCGVAFAIRRRIFDRVGRFDASLFYSGEELDLSYRVLAAGLGISFDPSLTVTHHRAGVRRDSTPIYFNARNRPWIALRHLPLVYCVTHCLAWWGWGLAMGVRKRAVGAALGGIRDCVARMPELWQDRQPIGTAILAGIKNGRLWY